MLNDLSGWPLKIYFLSDMHTYSTHIRAKKCSEDFSDLPHNEFYMGKREGMNLSKSSRTSRFFVIILIVLATITLVSFLFTAAQGRTQGINPNGEYQSLRADIVMITLPTSDTQTFDVIHISNTQISRIWGVKGIEPYQKRIIPTSNTLLVSINQLREEWCNSVPITPQLSNNTPMYRVVIACPLRNPVLYFPSEELDQRIKMVVATMTALSSE